MKIVCVLHGKDMRSCLSIVLTFMVTWLAFAQSVPPGDLIPLGTGVEIELLQDVSSETLQPGQAVPFKLLNPFAPHGVSLLPAGATFNGTVTGANSSGHWGKAGAFDLKLEPLKTADGTQVQLDFHRPARMSTRKEKTGETIGTALVLTYYFPLIPVALIGGSRKGKPFHIRSGERYLVYVTGVEGAAAATEPSHP
jgi:hypothetical protein